MLKIQTMLFNIKLNTNCRKLYVLDKQMPNVFNRKTDFYLLLGKLILHVGNIH